MHKWSYSSSGDSDICEHPVHLQGNVSPLLSVDLEAALVLFTAVFATFCAGFSGSRVTSSGVIGSGSEGETESE